MKKLLTILLFATSLNCLAQTLSDDTLFLFFTADRDPTASEPNVTAIGIPAGWPFWWHNTTNNTWYINQDNIEDALVWNGLNISRIRDYVTVSTPSFDTPRTPDPSRDIEVVAIVDLTSTILVAASVSVEIDGGGGYVERGRVGQSDLAGTNTYTLTFRVPANSSYKLVDSGTATIVKVSELPS